MEPTEKKSHGALIGSIIVIVIIIIGGIYVWQSKVKTLEEQPAPVTEEQTVNLPATNTNETATDLNDLNSLDQEANATDSNAGVDVNSIQ